MRMILKKAKRQGGHSGRKTQKRDVAFYNDVLPHNCSTSATMGAAITGTKVGAAITGAKMGAGSCGWTAVDDAGANSANGATADGALVPLRSKSLGVLVTSSEEALGEAVALPGEPLGAAVALLSEALGALVSLPDEALGALLSPPVEVGSLASLGNSLEYIFLYF
jgi:hypothetical protein